MYATYGAPVVGCSARLTQVAWPAEKPAEPTVDQALPSKVITVAPELSVLWSRYATQGAPVVGCSFRLIKSVPPSDEKPAEPTVTQALPLSKVITVALLELP